MKKYLAFDIEIAFDFRNISTDRFPPNDDEIVLLPKKIINEDGEKEEVWIEAKYIGGIIKRFRLQDGELVKSTHWSYQGNDWKRFCLLGITCAAAASSDGGLWNWYAHDAAGKFTDKMSRSQCHQLVDDLQWLSDDYEILTWNGLGFDFDILNQEARHQQGYCKELALNHIDMMLHFFASKGYPLGLDAAAKGMNLPGKPEGMTGAKAPELWASGEYHKVLDYVSWDVKNTLAVAEAVEATGRLDWTARSGRPNSWLCSKWLTAKEAMALPEPDVSWMSDPWPRSKFYGWTGHSPPPKAPPPTLSPIGDIDYDEEENE